MKKTLCLILFYAFARYLPASTFYVKFIGYFSKRIRFILCKGIFLKCGKDVNIERMAWFGRGSKIIIGDNSGIGINCKIHNNTEIGRDVMMGPNCYMLESTHKFDQTHIPMRQQGRKKERDKVIIGDDVWIGRDVMIIGSKDIKKGSIIGARCVLTKSFPEYSIIGGNPAKLIRKRI